MASGAPPVGATTTSSGQVAPGASTLFAVACSSPSTCYAVGQTLVGSVGAVAPITNGAPGAALALPDILALLDVACTSTTTCVAVGLDNPPGRQPPTGVFVVITDGVPGAPQPVPGTSQLNNIACSSATFCVALAGRVVVPITDGVPGPLQVVQGVETLSDIACPTSSATCYAVGYAVPDPNDPFTQTGVLVPITDGVAGTPQVVPGVIDVLAVTCPSPTTCYAVGPGEFFQPVVVGFVNGTSSAPQLVSGVDTLTAIACLTTSTCEAVGFSGSDAVVVPIVDGVPGTPQLVSGANALYGVACPTATTCQAVGVYSPTPGTNLGVVVTITEPPPAPRDPAQCKNGGWKSFTNPTFKNQGECVSSIVANRK